MSILTLIAYIFTKEGEGSFRRNPCPWTLCPLNYYLSLGLYKLSRTLSFWQCSLHNDPGVPQESSSCHNTNPFITVLTQVQNGIYLSLWWNILSSISIFWGSIFCYIYLFCFVFKIRAPAPYCFSFLVF